VSRRQIIRFAAYLAKGGMSPDSITSLHVLLDPQNAKEELRQMLDRNGGGSSRDISETAALLRNLAWVIGLPEAQREGLRNGAMIALLALMPLRRRALANLRLGESLFVSDNGITVALPADLTKSGRPWEAAVPAASLPALRRFLEDARPFLLARGDPAERHLWIGKKGTPLAESSVGSTIAEAVLNVTGVRVPPHFFRDAAATTLARHSSQAASMIRPILAQSSARTAERHYNHAQTKEAGRDYAALVATLKGGRPR
jgi:integrase/recombinase XerD